VADLLSLFLLFLTTFTTSYPQIHLSPLSHPPQKRRNNQVVSLNSLVFVLFVCMFIVHIPGQQQEIPLCSCRHSHAPPVNLDICKGPSHQGVSLQPRPSREPYTPHLQCHSDGRSIQESRRMFQIQFGVNHLVSTFYTHKSTAKSPERSPSHLKWKCHLNISSPEINFEGISQKNDFCMFCTS